MNTIPEQLQPASWRGIGFPFTGTRDFGFQQEQAQHRFIFRDQQLIESLGRQNPTFRYTIPFREGVQRPPWRNLFTKVYPLFIDACQDRSAGELVDPIHGTFRAKCVSLSESLSVEGKDGVDVTVEFVFAPEDGDSTDVKFAQVARTLEGLATSAVVFGAAVGEVSEAERKKVASLNKPAERADVSIDQTVRQATGFVQSTKRKTRAKLAEANSKMEVTRREIEEAKDPELELLRREASRTSKAAKDLATTLGDPLTPFEIILITAAIGRIAFAVAKGITVDVLLEMNPELEDVFFIPAGAKVKVPKKGG